MPSINLLNGQVQKMAGHSIKLSGSLCSASLDILQSGRAKGIAQRAMDEASEDSRRQLQI